VPRADQSAATVPAWRKRLRRLGPYAVDAGLAIAVAVAVTIAISVTREPGARPADAPAYALGVTLGALVLARRRWPLGVLLASVVALQAYYLADYPGMSAAVPLAVPLYTAAAAGHLRWALGVTAWYGGSQVVFVAVAALGYFGSLIPLDYTRELLGGVVGDASLMVAAVLLGDAVRNHRVRMAEATERLRRVEEDRKREAQELSAARVIQQQLLPKELPSLAGWRVAAYYQPARAVGGDFYDFLELPGGHVALVAGDVTDKGIPAALVMATTCGILRGDGPELVAPGAVLARANDRLHPDIPPHMFVTCLYAVLDPMSGRLRFANAGHSLPYLATAEGVRELRATGMPLGAMPGMTYEEHEAALAPGDSLLLHSDGLAEAHNSAGEMFGLPRLQQIVERSGGSEGLIDECLAALRAFVGRDWEQEDDITLVTLERDSSGSR
jgi:serine phosphatase RsbU (regulator of sigma subunit)